MPVVKHSLRDLAQELEHAARNHPAWSNTHAHMAVTSLINHLNALARVGDINQDDARIAQRLTFMYENYRGEFSKRNVNPISIRWGTSEWYKKPQWLLMCFDIGKQDRREFAILNMSNVKQLDRS